MNPNFGATVKYLAEQIKPDAKFGIDYEVRDDSDGRGPYISRWGLPEPRPGLLEIEAKEPDMIADRQTKATEKSDKKAAILGKFKCTEDDLRNLKEVLNAI